MARRSAKNLTDNASSGEAGNDGSSVRALVRGLSILRCFDVTHPAWTFVELRKKVGLSNATTYRLVKTLEAQGFLTLDQATSKYHLGSSMLQATYLMLSHSELARMAHPHMERLVALTGETVDMSVWTEEGPLHIYAVFTSRPFKPPQQIGQTFNDICNASAKVFLAFGPESRRQAVLARQQAPCTEYSIVDPDKLVSEWNRVRQDGVSYDFQEHVIGICAVAAPVRDSTGAVLAAIAVTPPVERFGPAEMRRCAEAVKETALALSHEMGYRGG